MLRMQTRAGRGAVCLVAAMIALCGLEAPAQDLEGDTSTSDATSDAAMSPSTDAGSKEASNEDTAAESPATTESSPSSREGDTAAEGDQPGQPGAEEQPRSDSSPLATIPVKDFSEAHKADDGSGGATLLEEVIVTASKRMERENTVPSSISVLSSSQLENIGASQFADFATYMPGVSFTSAGKGYTFVVMRGVTTGVEAGATVGIYVDEMALGTSTSYAIGSNAVDLNVFDIDQIEALKGPQGTLYGASTLGGLIKYVTAAPAPYTWQETAQLDGSNIHDGGTSSGIRAVLNIPLNIPIFDLPVGFRITGFQTKDAGFVDDPDRGRENLDSGETVGGRASLIAELGGGVSARLTALAQDIKRDGFSFSHRDLETHEPRQGQYDQKFFVDQPLSQTPRAYSGVLNWDFELASLTSVSSWQDLRQKQRADLTYVLGSSLGTGTTVVIFGEAPVSTKKFSQEIRLTSGPSTSLEWIAGAFYAAEDNRLDGDVRTPDTPDGTLAGAPIFVASIPSTYEELAGFGNVTWYFSEVFDVTAGMRYTANELHFEQRLRGFLNDPANPNAETVNASSGSETVATYMLSPRFRLSEDWLLYGRAASGYRPGGPNLVFTPEGEEGPPSTFQPDTVWNYELGTKLGFLDGAASLTAALYDVEWSDIQLIYAVANGKSIENGGTARVFGGEVGLTLRGLKGFALSGSASYTDAQLTEDAPNIEAKKGQALPLSPKLSAALSADYSLPLIDLFDATVGVSYRWVDDRPSGFEGSSQRPNYQLAAYDILDVRCGLKSHYFKLDLLLKNALNEDIELFADTLSASFDPDNPVSVGLGQPRSLGLQLTVDFAH